MRISRTFVVWAVLAGGAFGGMVALEATGGGDAGQTAAGTAGGVGDAPVLVGTAAPAGPSLMQAAPGAPIRIVAVLDWNATATTPLLAGRDCVAEPRTCHNGKDGIVLVYAAAAALPAQPQRATVLSDNACEPDLDGASHCVNKLRLADGRVITVRNDHRLANEPCLAGGEHVVVAAGAAAAPIVGELRRLAADRGGAWPSTQGMVVGSCTVSDAGLKRAGITRAQLGCSRPGG